MEANWNSLFKLLGRDLYPVLVIEKRPDILTTKLLPYSTLQKHTLTQLLQEYLQEYTSQEQAWLGQCLARVRGLDQSGISSTQVSSKKGGFENLMLQRVRQVMEDTSSARKIYIGE